MCPEYLLAKRIVDWEAGETERFGRMLYDDKQLGYQCRIIMAGIVLITAAVIGVCEWLK